MGSGRQNWFLVGLLFGGFMIYYDEQFCSSLFAFFNKETPFKTMVRAPAKYSVFLIALGSALFFTSELVSVGMAKLWKHIFLFVCVVTISFSISQLVQILFPTPRPFAVFNKAPLLEHIADPAFPSDHATITFSASFYLLLLSAGGCRTKQATFVSIHSLAVFMIVLTIIGAVARVACGLHWFRDLLGGFLIGGGVAYVFAEKFNDLKVSGKNHTQQVTSRNLRINALEP